MATFKLKDLSSSWLLWLDDNCIADEVANAVSGFSINSEDGQTKIIEVAIMPEYEALNAVSKNHYDEVLNIAIESSESQLENIFSSMSFSCVGVVSDKVKFVHNLKRLVNQ